MCGKGEFRKNWLCNIHTLLKRFKRISTHTFHTSWQTRVKFRVEYIHIMPLNTCGFRRYRCSETYSLLTGLKKKVARIFYILRPISIKFSRPTGISTNIYREILSFVKIGAVKAMSPFSSVNKLPAIHSTYVA